MIRSVAYYGDVVDGLPRADIERVARRAGSRNVDLGITGCLVCFDRYFIQILEGPFDDVERIYSMILSNGRNSNIIGLFDAVVETRTFSTWSLKFAERASNGEGGRKKNAFPLPTQQSRADDPVARSVQLLFTDFDRQIAGHLRVAPQQKRAKQTVERLLDAVNGLISSSRTFERLTLEAAAASAGVTQQSAYRYFANINDLIRAAVRRTQLHWNVLLLDFVMRQTFASALEIADAIVVYIIDNYENQVKASDKLKRDILRGYHDIEYDAAWTISDAISKSVADMETPPFRIEVAEMAAGLVALSAMTKSLILRDVEQLRRPAVRDMMIDILLSALGSPSQANSDAFARMV